MNETDQWIEYAGNDLRAADVLLDADVYNQVCFHAQQCVEKVFKAGLIAQGDVYPRSHNLIALLNLLDGERMTYRWFPLDALEQTRVYPIFLRAALRHIPDTVQHIVNVDDKEGKG